MADLVKHGAKTQTVRRRPKRVPVAGDTISCRAWTGKPYRSKQRTLGDFVVKRVADVSMWRKDGEFLMAVDGVLLSSAETTTFAIADGFHNTEDMRREFERMGELPLFNGICIYW
jgi:hypothetical protein